MENKRDSNLVVFRGLSYDCITVHPIMEFRFIPTPPPIDLHFGAKWNSILGQNGIPFYHPAPPPPVKAELFDTKYLTP